MIPQIKLLKLAKIVFNAKKKAGGKAKTWKGVIELNSKKLYYVKYDSRAMLVSDALRCVHTFRSNKQVLTESEIIKMEGR